MADFWMSDLAGAGGFWDLWFCDVWFSWRGRILRCLISGCLI